MPKFWKRAPEDPIDRLLVEQRPEPRDEFLHSLLERLGAAPAPKRISVGARPASLRLVAAVGLTLLALVAATAAAGGVGAASHGVVDFANVKHTFGFDSKTTSTKGNDAKPSGGVSNEKSDDPSNSGHQQYSVTICHATGSATNPYVQLTLSPQGAAQHLAHHPGDFLAPPEGCPGKQKNH